MVSKIGFVLFYALFLGSIFVLETNFANGLANLGMSGLPSYFSKSVATSNSTWTEIAFGSLTNFVGLNVANTSILFINSLIMIPFIVGIAYLIAEYARGIGG